MSPTKIDRRRFPCNRPPGALAELTRSGSDGLMLTRARGECGGRIGNSYSVRSLHGNGRHICDDACKTDQSTTGRLACLNAY